MNRMAHTWMIHQQQQHCKLQSKQVPLGEYHVMYRPVLDLPVVLLLWVAWLTMTA